MQNLNNEMEELFLDELYAYEYNDYVNGFNSEYMYDRNTYDHLFNYSIWDLIQ